MSAINKNVSALTFVDERAIGTDGIAIILLKSIFSFMSVNICFMFLGAPLLGT